MSWIKKEIVYLKDSLPQLINGIVIFLLVSSGLGFALLLNLFNLNGTVIAFISVIIQIIALILSYFLVRKYFTEKQPNQVERKAKL
jgi:ABC-type antimicrobial peptide transport system permease subunit